MNYEPLDSFLELFESINQWETDSLPLCAAENICSEFVKIPQYSFLQEKYVLGGIINYKSEGNFNGSRNLYSIFSSLQEQCKKMFNCKYADARTLSGLNAITTLIMALFQIGDTVYISSPQYGGHSSIQLICERLGLKTIYLPFDYANYDFNYDEINRQLKNKNIKGIIIALSDMIEHPNLKRLDLNNTILLYDVTQILGLIATKYMDNPFDWFKDSDNVILLGATHKTIPGPTCGLIMTNNLELAKRFDLKVNPDYLRNIQLNNVVSLLFSLFELDKYGFKYFNSMKIILNEVAKELSRKRINVIRTRDNTTYSKTHQLWYSVNGDINQYEQNALLAGVSLNIRKRKIYQDQGVRLGFQQVARFNWDKEAAKTIAQILILLFDSNCNYSKIKKLLMELPPKNINFTFDQSIKEKALRVLHYSDMNASNIL